MKNKTEFIKTASSQACMPKEKFNESYEALLNTLVRIFINEVITHETV